MAYDSITNGFLCSRVFTYMYVPSSFEIGVAKYLTIKQHVFVNEIENHWKSSCVLIAKYGKMTVCFIDQA